MPISRPAVLVVDPESSRRRGLARGLAGFGYEVIPAVDGEEGRRFARGLGPGVVVAPAGLPGFGDGSILADWKSADPASRRTLLLLGASGEEAAADLPAEVLFLAAGGLAGEDLVRPVRLALLGREIGVEADVALESLVGDLALLPLLELLRGLHRAGFTGRVVLGVAGKPSRGAADDGGEIVLEAGEVVAAAAGPVRGVKAFCRLARRQEGPFHVLAAPEPEAAGGPGEIGEDFKSLLILAIEDLVHDAPSPRARARVEPGEAFFAARFTPRQQAILTALESSPAVGSLLDDLAATDGEILRDLLELRSRGIVVCAEPVAPLRIVTDSTSDLPADLARDHGIEVVPLTVRFGDTAFRDGVDLSPRRFYELLEAGRDHPRTHPPSAAEFRAAYAGNGINGTRGAATAGGVLSLHLSEKLSQTVVHARAAAGEAADSHPAPAAFAIVDSGSVSLGLGLLALFAARLARRGFPAAEVVARIEAMRPRVHALFVVDTLEYLARGGRIGRARALLGRVLAIKPILGVVGGEVVAVDRVRGGRAAHPRLVELFRQRVDPARPVVAAIAHARAPVWADRLRALLQASFETCEMLVTEMGPVVGTHAGPGAVGAALFQPTAEELPLLSPSAPSAPPTGSP